MATPIIIDKNQVEANRARAKRMNVQGADFLFQHILDDLSDRLLVAQRRFETSLIVSPLPDTALETLTPHEKITVVSNTHIIANSQQLEQLDTLSESTELLIDLAHLHQINDVPGLLMQYRHALKPDGLFLACVPGGDTLSELRQSLLAAESALTGGVRPRILPFMDVRSAGALLQRAGFTMPVTDIDTLTVRYDTMFGLMRDLRAMGATNTLIDRNKSFSRRELFAHAAAYYADNFSDADGRIRATFSFIWMSGWAPDASQPKPLTPGSGKVSLADALKATKR